MMYDSCLYITQLSCGFNRLQIVIVVRCHWAPTGLHIAKNTHSMYDIIPQNVLKLRILARPAPTRATTARYIAQQLSIVNKKVINYRNCRCGMCTIKYYTHTPS